MEAESLTSKSVQKKSSAAEMPDWFYVWYEHPEGKGRRMGQNAGRFDDDAQKLWREQRMLLVADMILPETHEIMLEDVEPILRDDWYGRGKAVSKYQDEAFQAARAEARKAFGTPLWEKVRVGAMFRIQVADGYAFYVVTAVGKSKATVEWRGFGGDRYTDHHFGWGGSFSKREVERHVKWEDGVSELSGGD